MGNQNVDRVKVQPVQQVQQFLISMVLATKRFAVLLRIQFVIQKLTLFIFYIHIFLLEVVTIFVSLLIPQLLPVNISTHPVQICVQNVA
jgi:hypothetical protein